VAGDAATAPPAPCTNAELSRATEVAAAVSSSSSSSGVSAASGGAVTTQVTPRPVETPLPAGDWPMRGVCMTPPPASPPPAPPVFTIKAESVLHPSFHAACQVSEAANAAATHPTHPAPLRTTPARTVLPPLKPPTFVIVYTNEADPQDEGVLRKVRVNPKSVADVVTEATGRRVESAGRARSRSRDATLAARRGTAVEDAADKALSKRARVAQEHALRLRYAEAGALVFHGATPAAASIAALMRRLASDVRLARLCPDVFEGLTVQHPEEKGALADARRAFLVLAGVRYGSASAVEAEDGAAV
jgi:hypothetical protein